MKLSRYEEARKEALKALRRALCENNYIYENEYIIAIENVTDGYNVDFTRTDDGSWADEVFEQSFDIAVDCAYSHKETEYYVVLGKSHRSGIITLLEKRRLYVK